MKFLILSLVFLCACLPRNFNSETQSISMPLKPNVLSISEIQLPSFPKLRVRVGVQTPPGKIDGDVFYIHGFADSMENQAPLFNEWNGNGMRVIAFDVSNGDSSKRKTLSAYPFMDIPKIATEVERQISDRGGRPLFVAGWSSGALIAIRMQQSKEFPKFSRRVSGLILISPAVDFYPLVGENGNVTDNTITNNPKPLRVVTTAPQNNVIRPLFNGRAKYEGINAFREGLPEYLPVVSIAGGIDTDKYARAVEVKNWASSQRKMHKARIYPIACSNGFHEMQNDLPPVGPLVRSIAGKFPQLILNQKLDTLKSYTGACASY